MIFIPRLDSYPINVIGVRAAERLVLAGTKARLRRRKDRQRSDVRRLVYSQISLPVRRITRSSVLFWQIVCVSSYKVNLNSKVAIQRSARTRQASPEKITTSKAFLELVFHKLKKKRKSTCPKEPTRDDELGYYEIFHDMTCENFHPFQAFKREIPVRSTNPNPSRINLESGGLYGINWIGNPGFQKRFKKQRNKFILPAVIEVERCQER